MRYTRLIITRPERAESLIHWGRQIAEARGTPLEVLVVSSEKAPSVEAVPLLEEGATANGALLTAVRDAVWHCWRPKGNGAQLPLPEDDEGEDTPAKPVPGRVPDLHIQWVRHPTPVDGVLQHLGDGQTHTLLVPCLSAPRSSATGIDALPGELFQRAQCSVILLRPHPTEEAPLPQVLVPLIKDDATASEQAALALGFALTSRHDEGHLHVMSTLSERVEDYEAVGRRITERKLGHSKVPASARVEVHTEAGEDPWAGLRRHLDDHAWLGEEGAAHTLMLVGAERWADARRALFGTVPDNRVRSVDGMSLAVLRRRRPLGERLRNRAERWLALTLPQMSREGRIELSSRLETGSAWGYDFMVLISLATAIAALGLIQGSGAVVIGAMLVAPLMTPLLGSGLALVQGNVRLIRSAARAVTLGFATALLLGAIVGLCAPTRALTGELLARTAPNILDLGVAFLSGIAAAFALSRPGLLAALPGVSIAAALVPPIATTGITLSWGYPEIAWKSALLFGTNVVAIILGSAVALYMGGIRPRKVKDRSWAARVALILTVAMSALSVVLTVMFFNAQPPPHGAPKAQVMSALEAGLAPHDATLVSADIQELGDELEVSIEAPRRLSPEALSDLARRAGEAHGKPLRLRVKTALVTVIGAPQ